MSLTRNLLSEQRTVTKSYVKAPEGSINLRAIANSFINKTISGSKNGKAYSFSTTKIAVLGVNIKKAIQSQGGRTANVEETANGVRFRRSGVSKKAELFGVLKRGMEHYKLKQSAAAAEILDGVKSESLSFTDPAEGVQAPVVDSLLPTAPAPTTALGSGQEEEIGSFYINLDEEPFRSNPTFVIEDNQTYWIEVKGSFSPAKTTEISVDGVYFDPWVSDPSKTKIKARSTSMPSIAANSVFPSEEVVENEEQFEEGTGGDDDTVDWSKYEVVDPVTGKSIRFTLRATSLSQTISPVNMLPKELRIKQLFNINGQIFENPVSYGRKAAHKQYAAVISSAFPEEVPAGMERGSLVGQNDYSRYNFKTGQATTADDPETFHIVEDKKGNQKSAIYPVNVTVSNFIKVPLEATEAILDQYPGYTKLIPIDLDGVPSHKVVVQEVNVRSTIWAEQCRSSCIANLASWIYFNMVHPIPAVVVLQPNKKSTSSYTFDMNVTDAAFDTISWLNTHGIPITADFMKKIFNDRTILECLPLGVEKVNRWSAGQLSYEDKTIENVGNRARGTLDLVNLSEFNGDITPYLDPKWEKRVMLVPMYSDMKEYDSEKKGLFDQYYEQLAEAKTPEAGVEALTAFLKEVYKGQYKVSNLAYNKRDFCSNVFAFRRPETLHPISLLQGLPHYKSYEPIIKAPKEDAPAPAPVPAPVPAPAADAKNRTHDEMAATPVESEKDLMDAAAAAEPEHTAPTQEYSAADSMDIVLEEEQSQPQSPVHRKEHRIDPEAGISTSQKRLHREEKESRHKNKKPRHADSM